LYSGGCKDHFDCHKAPNDISCQKLKCGQYAFSSTEEFVSFNDAKHKNNVLTIPKLFYSDVDDMVSRCHHDNGKEMMKEMLAQGRKAFENNNVTKNLNANWQCVHLPGTEGRIGVHWMHLHTFSDKVGGSEQLPDKPPRAACVETWVPVQEAADILLNLAKPHLLAANTSIVV